MSIQRINQAGSSFVQPFTATGTYTLSRALPAGFYRITTDTVQAFTAAQLYFQTTTGYRFGVVVRGGQGYVSIPLPVEQVVFGSGTFPLLLGMELIPAYPLIAAPTTTNANVTWGNPVTVNQTFSLAFTLPPTATGIGIYWRNGTFTDLATTTSPKTAIVTPTLPTFDAAYPFLVATKDANGVWGLGIELSPTFIYVMYTANGTYTTPAWSTNADVLIVAGGGGGAGGSASSYGGGGGGAGGLRFLTGLATAGAISVSIGALGSGGAGNAQGTSGGNSSFGATSATGGGRGGGYSGTVSLPPANGGSGGGQGYVPQAVGTGIAGQGFAGGTAVVFYSGGGGGATSVGSNGNSGGVAAPGGTGATHYAVVYSQGGSGGGNSGIVSGPNAGGGGAGGHYSGNQAGAAGKAGIVIVKANGTPP